MPLPRTEEGRTIALLSIILSPSFVIMFPICSKHQGGTKNTRLFQCVALEKLLSFVHLGWRYVGVNEGTQQGEMSKANITLLADQGSTQPTTNT